MTTVQKTYCKRIRFDRLGYREQKLRKEICETDHYPNQKQFHQELFGMEKKLNGKLAA